MATGARRYPLMQGLLPVERARLPGDVVAGVTLAALAIPEVMGYAKIAQLPVVMGLYTILIPLVLFALLGSSRHLVVGADSATAAIMAAGLTGLAAAGSAEYVGMAGVLAIMVGGLLIVARLVRLGFIADFLSRTVLIGFLTGVGSPTRTARPWRSPWRSSRWSPAAPGSRGGSRGRSSRWWARSP